MIKIAFFDVDGTLLNFGHKDMTERTLYALQELRKRGVLLCMSTGRSFYQIPRFPDFEFDILLTFNGSYILNEQEIIYSNPLQQQDVQIIMQNLNEMERAMVIGNRTILAANAMDDDIREYFEIGHTTVEVVNHFEELLKGEVYQVMCACHEGEYEQILKGTDNAKIVAWWERAADIIPADGGKGVAINKVLDYYGLQKKHALAFGDGHNDIAMLENVGRGIAMGNAADEVKKSADAVCLSVAEDGIYHYLKEHDFI